MSAFSRGFGVGSRLSIMQPARIADSLFPPQPSLISRLSKFQPSGARSLSNTPSSLACRQSISKIHLARPSLIRHATTYASKARSAPTTPIARPRSFAEQIAQRGPTTLYEGPSHFWMRFSCFSAATFCMGYAAINYWSMFLYPPEGLAMWVPHAFAVICVTMGAMGGYYILGTANIVRQIRAIPTSTLGLTGRRTMLSSAGPGVASKASAAIQATGTTAARSAAPSAKAIKETEQKGMTNELRQKLSVDKTPIVMEIMLSRVIPIIPARIMLAVPSDIVLAGPLQGAFTSETAHMSVKDRLAAERAEMERKKAERKWQIDHIMTLPFRQLGRGFAGMWMGLMRGLTRDGFMPVRINGTKYRLDVTGGFVLDHGRAIDRLVNINQTAA